MLLCLRDFRYRYRQAFLKYVWAFARPLLAVAPLILVGNAFGLGGDMSAAEYALFALSGFLMWQMFWDAVISPQWIARRLRRTCVDGPLRPEAMVAAVTKVDDSMPLIKQVITSIISRQTVDQLEGEAFEEVRKAIRKRLNEEIFNSLFTMGQDKMVIEVQDFIVSRKVVQ